MQATLVLIQCYWDLKTEKHFYLHQTTTESCEQNKRKEKKEKTSSFLKKRYFIEIVLAETTNKCHRPLAI
jgi:hypothetical protein